MKGTKNYYKIVTTGDHYDKSSNLSFQLQITIPNNNTTVKDQCEGLLVCHEDDRCKTKNRKIDLASGVQCQKNSINN
jgi:hypothetical protein